MSRFSIKEKLLSQEQCRGIIERRQLVDLLRNRFDLLKSKDRAIVKMYYEGGCTYEEIAKLLGVNRSHICRKMSDIVFRLKQADKILSLRYDNDFSFIEEAIGIDYYIKGMSRNKISQKRECSLYRVRKILLRIEKHFKDLNDSNQGRTVMENGGNRHEPNYRC